MAGVDISNGKMREAEDALEVRRALQQQQKVEDASPQQSFESGSEQELPLSLGLSVDSRYDERQDEQGYLSEEQIEKLKEFLSEAACRGDDVVRQSDADTVKAIENMRNLQLGAKSETGLGALLESAARANLEIQNQAASGYYPSETVYLEEHTLHEVLEESGAVISLELPSTEHSHSPRVFSPAGELPSPDIEPSPTRNIDAESDLKNELDCLFQERAVRYRGSP